MTDLRAQKRMASDLLGRGKNGIWVDPEAIFKVSSAITREDVSKLIHDGIIKPKRSLELREEEQELVGSKTREVKEEVLEVEKGQKLQDQSLKGIG